jgi:hypothetical protein
MIVFVTIVVLIYIIIKIKFRYKKPKLTAMGIRCADHATPSIR